VVPSPVQSNLNSIVYANSNYYIVGDNGSFLYSTNGGFNFLNASVFPNNNFYQVIYGFGGYTAVGQNGSIYIPSGTITTPWIQQPSGTTGNLYSISNMRSSYDPITFRRIAVGSNGIILSSTWNSGTNWSSWTTKPSGTNQDLYTINFWFLQSSSFNINNTGLAGGNNGVLLRTTNFGENWISINSGITNKIYCLSYLDTAIVWLTGSNGLIMRSTNNGTNWVTIPSGTTSDLKYFSTRYSNTDSVYYICGNNGVILQSTNRGVNWISTLTPTTNNLNSISYPFVVGNSGKILRRDTDSSFITAVLEGNNIRAYINSTGIFDQNTKSGNLSGFVWPKDSNKTAVFTAGLSIAGFYQGQFREAMASYKGEYLPGFCNNGIAHTNDTFKFYNIKRGDGYSTNQDWANWGLMVPYGAPFVDVNNNGIYNPQIDTPGVRGASQTIFLCMTDGFPESHTSGEGFGGGTPPLYSEVHLTAWCYSQPSYNDMQFLKFVIINKGLQPWTRTYLSLISDTDLGWANDDYIGCDTSRKLGFCYNGTNFDQSYGTAPPAVGFILLKGSYNKYTNPPKQLDLTSFVPFYGSSIPGGPCESDPNGEAYPAYLMMQGYKKDSTCWLDPTQLITPPNFYKKTKFVYAGDPETNSGWTEIKGIIHNCNHDSSGNPVIPAPVGDVRFLLNSGADNLTVMPGDTQTIVICQLIARGSSNLNSVTKLKQLADVAIQFYNSGYVIGINKISSEVPSKFRLEQNYPNPFNPKTKIKFDIAPLSRGAGGVWTELKIYDITGREIQTLVNEKLNPGTYEVTFDGSNFASGVYFYQLRTGEFVNTKKLILLK
jgi:photosystem II stability/assembly factor-like uncharacterized protein